MIHVRFKNILITKVEDVRVDCDSLATLPSAQILRIDWTTGQREPQERLANLPRIMDLLRSAV